MLKNISRLQHLIGDKVYHFTCDSDSPINEVKAALLKFIEYVDNVEAMVKEKMEKEKEDKVEVVEAKEE